MSKITTNGIGLEGETVFWRIKGKFGDTEENYSEVWQLIVEQ
jgi:hypothetical protein